MEELLNIIKQQSSTINHLSNELALLREQVAYLTQKLYEKSSEKWLIRLVKSVSSKKTSFQRKIRTYPVGTETITYKRKKAKGVRQAIFNQFTPEIIHQKLKGEDCICPDSHSDLKEIGSCIQRQELVFIPAQLKRVVHIQHAYKCQNCSEEGLTDKIIKAPIPKAPLSHSLYFASIIAHTIHQKFNLKVPNYRQEED